MWAIISHYGILRFVRQARIQVGIATELMEEHQECRDAGHLARIESAIPCLKNTINGCLAELDQKIALEADGPGGLDYREDVEINTAIVKFLTDRFLIRHRTPHQKGSRPLFFNAS